MRLRESEWELLMDRLAAAKDGSLDAAGEQVLRFLVSKANSRAATMSLQELVDLGLFLVGWRRFRQLVYGSGDVGVTA